MSTFNKRTRPTLPEVQAWLERHHPELAAKAEPERSWLWLPVDLRGEQNKAVRESLKKFGFRWAKKGHALPSGQVGTWGHSANRPKPFTKGGKGNGQSDTKTENKSLDDALLSEIDAVLGEE